MQLCHEINLPHVINNAYGLQDSCAHFVNEACHAGRVDYCVQSTDKNFMVPVGGSIVFSPSKANIDDLTKHYPGRASGSPMLDLLITLLQMGRSGLRDLRTKRKELFHWFQGELKTLSSKYSQITLLNTSKNKTSMALRIEDDAHPSRNLQFIGSHLFSRRCSGCRLITCDDQQNDLPEYYVAENPNVKFVNFGSHSNVYPCHYMTVACAIGATQDELVTFLQRLDKVILDNFVKQADTKTDSS